MTLKLSTGLRDKLLAQSSLKALLEAGDGGCIRIFTGPVPNTADAAETGTLLCVITKGSAASGTPGSTLTFEATATGGVLAKDVDVWSGVNVATGQAAYYRHVATGDTGAASTTEVRMQGAVAVLGAELNLSSVALVNGATQTINSYFVSAPTL